jgi:ferric-dicitrate binding protein FerR (iron transport regulator)
MTNEDNSLVDRYRASVEEVPDSNVDQEILAAARQQSASRRFVRRTRMAFFVTAVTAVAIILTWRSHPLNPTQSHVADYGKSEGATRSYLLSAMNPPYSGAGITEGAP